MRARRSNRSWDWGHVQSNSRWLIQPGTITSGEPDPAMATAMLTPSGAVTNWICCFMVRSFKVRAKRTARIARFRQEINGSRLLEPYRVQPHGIVEPAQGNGPLLPEGEAL